ncbi:MAG: hypothetical protein EWV53_18060 [Microcystis panniformis Mp_MB_F_20051200_S9]|uniref:Uncharacterized protein n=1 Tax=Microcystis panniformis Mp_MB_F_20051200_S9 TaxID=2486223 RepID=A0A552PPG5_9CHRO|nr:MAG: hypothetical protein EWV43_19965 [Microcystis panniformis Mp_MB_F_20080800_S26D]TRV54801.1 MAG: hypothetical protein EWV87_00115 [Microcystis panniformis Mp_GB_SS_20050300_S99]TRV55750.1 MAG: hypothetical protein EWV42_00865 [Microcystis panniformis Mp_GB_SS_20050300_S99D]TRV56068.1 MAG: hypothetical protein EWV86_23275 [Microcystis panniformis Mp_MB_F_20051200_S9D]TRV58870.1 MAG: hypothetical protein EWV53_18060 [Microcystis panniformis Mp_MB_F_20051200_S9]TRV59009.1 MAG: hypothetical
MLYLGILCNFMPFFLIFELSKINYARTLLSIVDRCVPIISVAFVSSLSPLSCRTFRLVVELREQVRVFACFPNFNNT